MTARYKRFAEICLTGEADRSGKRQRDYWSLRMFTFAQYGVIADIIAKVDGSDPLPSRRSRDPYTIDGAAEARRLEASLARQEAEPIPAPMTPEQQEAAERRGERALADVARMLDEGADRYRDAEPH